MPTRSRNVIDAGSRHEQAASDSARRSGPDVGSPSRAEAGKVQVLFDVGTQLQQETEAADLDVVRVRANGQDARYIQHVSAHGPG